MSGSGRGRVRRAPWRRMFNSLRACGPCEAAQGLQIPAPSFLVRNKHEDLESCAQCGLVSQVCVYRDYHPTLFSPSQPNLELATPSHFARSASSLVAAHLDVCCHRYPQLALRRRPIRQPLHSNPVSSPTPLVATMANFSSIDLNKIDPGWARKHKWTLWAAGLSQVSPSSSLNQHLTLEPSAPPGDMAALPKQSALDT